MRNRLLRAGAVLKLMVHCLRSRDNAVCSSLDLVLVLTITLARTSIINNIGSARVAEVLDPVVEYMNRRSEKK